MVTVHSTHFLPEVNTFDDVDFVLLRNAISEARTLRGLTNLAIYPELQTIADAHNRCGESINFRTKERHGEYVKNRIGEIKPNRSNRNCALFLEWLCRYCHDQAAAFFESRNKPFPKEFIDLYAFCYLNSDPEMNRNTKWKLESISTNSFDIQFYSFGLENVGQEYDVKCPIDIVLDVFARPISDDTGYKFGFNSIEITTNVVSQSMAETTYNRKFLEPQPVRDAILTACGGGDSKFWRLFALSALDGEYVVGIGEIFRILPKSEKFEFQARMSAHLYDGSLVRSDGSQIPNGAKKSIIAKLLSKKILPNDPENGKFHLMIRQYSLALKSYS